MDSQNIWSIYCLAWPWIFLFTTSITMDTTQGYLLNRIIMDGLHWVRVSWTLLFCDTFTSLRVIHGDCWDCILFCCYHSMCKLWLAFMSCASQECQSYKEETYCQLHPHLVLIKSFSNGSFRGGVFPCQYLSLFDEWMQSQ